MSVEQQKPEVVYIDRQNEFRDWCAKLQGCKRLAVDTEFVGEKYYFPRLEIIQLRADDGPIGIIDAQTICDWSPLGALLADAQILKLFHAADQDVELLSRSTGVRLVNLHDTQLAASMLGYGAQISLANLARLVVGAEVSGKQTTSDWSHRPLSADQIAYAATDVLHLHAIHDHMEAGLRARGRLNWFLDEQTARLSGSGSTEADPMESWRRVKEWNSLSGRDLAVLRELAALREQKAREKNVPRKHILSDDSLVELARFQPDTQEKLSKLRRVNVPQAMRLFSEIREATRRGRLLPREEWPTKPVAEKVDIPTGLVELCQALLRSEAEAHEVAPTIIATTSELTQLIVERANLAGLDNPLLRGWRRELVGERLIGLLQGRVQIVVGSDGRLVFEDRIQ